MPGTVGFLHTSTVHVPVFERLMAEIAPTMAVRTAVDGQLLADARVAGPGTRKVVAGVSARIDELVAADAEVIVCTCSTIGEIAERIGSERGLDVVRVDRVMVERAVEIGGRILVLVALESTLGPTNQLLSEVADAAGREIDVRVETVHGAWGRFESGDRDGYLNAVAQAIDAASDDIDVIVLAQASMADASDRTCTTVPVLSSPRAAVEALFTSPGATPR